MIVTYIYSIKYSSIITEYKFDNTYIDGLKFVYSNAIFGFYQLSESNNSGIYQLIPEEKYLGNGLELVNSNIENKLYFIDREENKLIIKRYDVGEMREEIFSLQIDRFRLTSGID